VLLLIGGIMKKFIMWLFRIKPEIQYVDRVVEKVVEKKVVEKEPDIPNGSILIEADKITIGDVIVGVE
jgi:hypothetical protein